MDFFNSLLDLLSIASVIVVLLMNVNRDLMLISDESRAEEDQMDIDLPSLPWETNSTATDATTQAAIHHFHLFSFLSTVDEDLGFWVKPRSTTWFTRFLLHEYDDARWIQMFRMTKRFVFSLTHLLAAFVHKQDTKYRLAIPVSVRIACSLFKLSHGVSLLICSELFAVGRSTVSIMLREFVHVVNTVFRREMTWPRGDRLVHVGVSFEMLCGLPGVVGAIDGTHIAIKKSRLGASDYYYFKSGGYTMNCQAVVDSEKRFLDVYAGMPGSTNDSRMLRRSTLYYQANQLFNKRLSKRRVVVENAFGQLKSTFRKLLLKTDLDVVFLPDVVICCMLLHNVLLRQSHEDVELLLDVLRQEDMLDARRQESCDIEDWQVEAPTNNALEEGRVKRRDLGVYLALQRGAPP